jgi:hypothetical protein
VAYTPTTSPSATVPVDPYTTAPYTTVAPSYPPYGGATPPTYSPPYVPPYVPPDTTPAPTTPTSPPAPAGTAFQPPPYVPPTSPTTSVPAGQPFFPVVR